MVMVIREIARVRGGPCLMRCWVGRGSFPRRYKSTPSCGGFDRAFRLAEGSLLSPLDLCALTRSGFFMGQILGYFGPQHFLFFWKQENLIFLIKIVEHHLQVDKLSSFHANLSLNIFSGLCDFP